MLSSWQSVVAISKMFISFIGGLTTGDSFDLFWYNNNMAAGSQLYPTDLELFYDLYSL